MNSFGAGELKTSSSDVSVRGALERKQPQEIKRINTRDFFELPDDEKKKDAIIEKFRELIDSIRSINSKQKGSRNRLSDAQTLPRAPFNSAGDFKGITRVGKEARSLMSDPSLRPKKPMIDDMKKIFEMNADGKHNGESPFDINGDFEPWVQELFPEIQKSVAQFLKKFFKLSLHAITDGEFRDQFSKYLTPKGSEDSLLTQLEGDDVYGKNGFRDYFLNFAGALAALPDLLLNEEQKKHGQYPLGHYHLYITAGISAIYSLHIQTITDARFALNRLKQQLKDSDFDEAEKIYTLFEDNLTALLESENFHGIPSLTKTIDAFIEIVKDENYQSLYNEHRNSLTQIINALIELTKDEQYRKLYNHYSNAFRDLLELKDFELLQQLANSMAKTIQELQAVAGEAEEAQRERRQDEHRRVVETVIPNLALRALQSQINTYDEKTSPVPSRAQFKRLLLAPSETAINDLRLSEDDEDHSHILLVTDTIFAAAKAVKSDQPAAAWTAYEEALNKVPDSKILSPLKQAGLLFVRTILPLALLSLVILSAVGTFGASLALGTLAAITLGSTFGSALFVGFGLDHQTNVRKTQTKEINQSISHLRSFSKFAKGHHNAIDGSQPAQQQRRQESVVQDGPSRPLTPL